MSFNRFSAHPSHLKKKKMMFLFLLNAILNPTIARSKGVEHPSFGALSVLCSRAP